MAGTLFKSGQVDEGLTKLQEAFEQGSLPETEWHLGEVYLFQAQTAPGGLKKDVLATAQQTLKSALAKVNASKQNGEVVDLTLVTHIEDAIKRANNP